LFISLAEDEDAIEVAKIHGYDTDEETPKLIRENSKAEATKASVVDYLRSKGYALPFLGMSVEEQINLGWIKLKEEK
jgi:hypothetical protein